ncbi:MAG: hypothetical protein ACLFQV_11325 [Vulcanimicrobiota bacterium]
MEKNENLSAFVSLAFNSRAITGNIDYKAKYQDSSWLVKEENLQKITGLDEAILKIKQAWRGSNQEINAKKKEIELRFKGFISENKDDVARSMQELKKEKEQQKKEVEEKVMNRLNMEISNMRAFNTSELNSYIINSSAFQKMDFPHQIKLERVDRKT